MQNLQMGINLSTQGLSNGLKKAGSEFDKFKSTIGTLGKMEPLAAGAVALGAFAAGAAIATVATIKLADAVATMADDLDESAQKLGTSIEFYQKLQSAANKTGVEMGVFSAAMKTVVNTAYDASQGNDKLASTYKSIGVSITDSSGKLKDQEQLLGDVLLALSNMEQGTRRTAIANDLLGKASAELAPLINQGSDAIKKYITENDSAVLVSQRLADASSQYKDSMQELNEVVTKARNESLEPLVETLVGVANGFLAIAKSEGIQTFFDGVTISAQKLSDTLDPILFNLGLLSKSTGGSTGLKGDLEALAKIGKDLWDTEVELDKLAEKGNVNSARAIQLKTKYDNLVKEQAVQQKQYIENQKEQARLDGIAAENEAKLTATEAARVKAEKDADEAKKQGLADYNAAVAKALAIADTARKENLSTTLAGRITLIDKEEKRQIDSINAVKDKELDKAAALEDIQIRSARERTDETNKFNAEVTANRIAGEKEINSLRESYNRNAVNSAKEYYDIVDRINKAKKTDSGSDPKSKLSRVYLDEMNDVIALDEAIKKTTDDIEKLEAAQKAAAEAAKPPKITQGDAPDADKGPLPKFTESDAQRLEGLKEFMKVLPTARTEAKSIMGETAKAVGGTIDQISARLNELAESPTTIWGRIFKVTDEDEALLNRQIDMGKQLTDATLNMFSTISEAKYQAAVKDAETDKARGVEELNSMNVTSRQKERDQKKIDATYEKARQEAFDRTKGLKVAQVQMDAASGIMAAWGTSMELGPIAGPIMAGVMTGLLGTTALIQSANIANAKYAAGGLLKGNSHANGGIETPYGELEGGEAVINKRSSSMFRNELSALNVAGGGRSFSDGSSSSIMGSTIHINIDRFSGGDDELSRLEDMLTTLQSNGRIRF